MEPQEIQVGILKRLRGTPIVRHDREWGMQYSPHPPYEILCNKLMDFETLQRLRRFARFWDLLANSGRFSETLPWLWRGGLSPFESFLRFSDWLGAKLGRSHSIALVALAEHLYRYLSGELRHDGVAAVLRADWFQGGIKRERLPFLEEIPENQSVPRRPQTASPKRQQRHLSG